MVEALLDLTLITFFCSLVFVVLGACEIGLEWLERAGRRLRGLPLHDGDD